MSILRIATSPADVGVGGYTWNENDSFDNTRVGGAFKFYSGDALRVDHAPISGNGCWYHFRWRQTSNYFTFDAAGLVQIKDTNSVTICDISVASGAVYTKVYGTTTVSSGVTKLADSAQYSMDLHVTVDTNITLRWYINAALVAETTVVNSTKTAPSALFLGNTDGDGQYNISEIIIADEDTRGMRIRELRPKSFGVFQEWDGSISAIRDTDLATGISVDVVDRRVSFGVSNLENISAGDVINRVVFQTYAQKGEVGVPRFNHFFRMRDGNVYDGADNALTFLGKYYIEEFLTNPATSVSWVPDDFKSIQTGLRSRAAA